MRKLFLAALVVVIAQGSLRADEWKSLFNGKDLTGWDGPAGYWSVEDGALTGQSTEANPLKYNQFLIWRGGTPANFELKAKFKLRNHNSGIQYRSHENPDIGPYSVGGYQADMDETNKYTGMCYEEKGRGIFSMRGNRVWIMPDGTKYEQSLGDPAELAKKVKLGEWNDFEIIANGNHMIHKINGVVMTEFFDHQADARSLKGIIAFQMHQGPPMKVQFKDIMLKTLPDGGILSPEQAAPPADAKKAEAAAKKKGAPKGDKKAPKKGEKKAEAPAPASAAPVAAAAAEGKKEKAAAGGKAGLAFDQGALPKWIWATETQAQQTVYFRKVAAVPGKPAAATVYISADNGATVIINGQPAVVCKDWQKPATADVTKLLKEGDNVIAVEATNRGGSAAMTLKLLVRAAGEKSPIEFVTDESWTVSMTPPAKGWDTEVKLASADFAASKVMAPYGAGPWGDVFGKTPNITRNTFRRSRNDDGPAYTGPPVAGMTVPEGFKVELLYTVPKEQEGSWVSMTFDPKGRIIASDQNGILYRVTLDTPAAGQVKVEPVEAIWTSPDGAKKEALGGAHGLLWAFDSLYAMVSDGNVPRGLYRLQSTKGDDQFDKVTLIRELKGSGEHGPHSIVPTPDGKGLYLVAGNHTDLPAIDGSRVPRNWQEDQLLPRMPDANGHAATRMAPGGWIMRIDPDGKNWELHCSGFRNEFDAAVNSFGDLFAYDADMEWDIGLPWYRPTRVNHCVSGAEFGWRNGSGKWPAYYADSLPSVVDIGPGSPTGIRFGYGAKFPAKYQNALFMNDWSYGILYAVHFKPEGASYSATVEKFITGRPLPLTDQLIGPDGAMYFAVGGRRTQSGLYRVTYVGKESTAPAPQTMDPATKKLHDLRHSLEAFHGRQDPKAVDAAWPNLSHPDRFIRFAARIAIEHQPVEQWQARVFTEKNPEALITAAIALARNGDKSLQGRLLETLGAISMDSLNESQQLELLRAYELAFIRMGKPDAATASAVGRKLGSLYPAASFPLNRELSILLVYLDAPGAVASTLKLLTNEHSDAAEQVWYAYALRASAGAWTIDQRKQFLGWFHSAAAFKGGHSFGGYVRNIRKEAIAGFSSAERESLKAEIADEPKDKPLTLSPAAGRTFVKMYEMKDLGPLVEKELSGRDFDRGKAMFSVAACSVCHRLGNEGGAIGPDLTQLGTRFSSKDILESIIDPSKVISDQYEQTIFTMEDGSVVMGRIVNLSGDGFRVLPNMLDADNQVSVDRRKLKEIKPSPVSPMPPGLLSMLKEDEVLDLLAYLKSGGNRDDKMFNPRPRK